MSIPHRGPESALRRVMQRVRIDLDTGCWLFGGARHQNGYGATRWNGRLYKTHRLMFTLLRHEVPAGLDLDHLRRRRECCNPFHLEPVTRAENLRRGRAAA